MAFISYSWADRDWGEWLHRSLETYRAPSGVADGQSLHPIFKDREEEAAGVSVGAAIEAALEASEFLIVICSPRSAQSMWVNREVAWFKTHKNKANILALIVDGEPGAAGKPGREAEECFPKTLTRKVGRDLQPTEEWEDAPLAADARAEGDGKRGAKLKLAAALLGVGLDALVRRDERRRTIRRRFVTSAAFALAGVLGGLAVFAFNQRDAALVAQKEAVKARDDAEGIIELILTDLKSDLEGFGTLKSVTAIGNRAVGYYEGQDVKALTPDQLGRRARVLLMLGEADNKRGDLTAALARYETAAATTKEQLTRDPENPQRMFDHAQSVFWVGYIAWQRGDRTAAKRQFAEYHDLAQKLVATDPANEDWQAELEYAYSNLGTLAMDDGEAAEAQGWFRKALDISLAKLAKAPTEIERVLAVGQSYAWLADALYLEGTPTDAARVRQQERAIYASQNGARAHAAAAVSQFSQAVAELASGNIFEAGQNSEAAARHFDEIVRKNPENADFATWSAYARTIFAEVLVHQGRNQLAIDTADRAVGQIDQLIAVEPSVTKQWAVWAQANLVRARALATTDSNEAIEVLKAVEHEMLKLRNAATWNPDLARRYCAALSSRARLSRGYEANWNEIVRTLTVDGKRSGPEAAALLAEAYQMTDRTDDAMPHVERLYAAGYRHPDFKRLLDEFPNLKAAAEGSAQ